MGKADPTNDWKLKPEDIAQVVVDLVSHALLTNDVETLAAGKGTYAAYLTPQGRMISDMTVLETDRKSVV